jgi:hypothetical protein
MSLNFAENDPDNLVQGIQPFDLFIVDHRIHMSLDAMRMGRDKASHDYNVTADQGNTSLSDARTLRGSTHAHVSFGMIHADAMLEATIVVLCTMLGYDHSLVISAAYFMARYNADRLSVHHHLAINFADRHDTKFFW